MAPAWSDKEPLATRGFFEALHSLWFAESRCDRKKRLGAGLSGYAAEIVANRGEGIRFLWVIPKTHEHAVRRLLDLIALILRFLRSRITLARRQSEPADKLQAQP